MGSRTAELLPMVAVAADEESNCLSGKYSTLMRQHLTHIAAGRWLHRAKPARLHLLHLVHPRNPYYPWYEKPLHLLLEFA